MSQVCPPLRIAAEWSGTITDLLLPEFGETTKWVIQHVGPLSVFSNHMNMTSIYSEQNVQLVGGGPLLGEQVGGVVQLRAGPAVLMGDGAPFWSH